MDKEQITRILEENGIRPTAVHILVARMLVNAESPLSLAELETSLDTAPKSTIFRTLNLFLQHRLVQGIEDGSNSLKYEFCHTQGNNKFDDMHIHFYCEECQHTYCLKNIQIPTIELPDGYSMDSINYMVKGICNKCNSNKQ